MPLPQPHPQLDRYWQQLQRDDVILLPAAPLLLYERAGRLSVFLLCFSFTHIPYYLPEH